MRRPPGAAALPRPSLPGLVVAVLVGVAAVHTVVGDADAGAAVPTVEVVIVGESGDTRGVVPTDDAGPGNRLPRRYDVRVGDRFGSFVSFDAYRIGESVRVVRPTDWDRLVVVDARSSSL